MSLFLFVKSKRFRQDAGIALLTSLLLLFLMASLLVGFSLLLISNQQLAGSNNDQVEAFYGAEAGMEQLTANLGNLFALTYSPTISQINALEATPPSIPGIQYINGNGQPAYTITPQVTDGNGNPAPSITNIKSGTYKGMYALATEYTLIVNARTVAGREVTLKRTTQTVGIPMYQFGIYSDTDLSFFPGPNFSFGGRTHTNGNLFLAEGDGSLLTLSDRVDAWKDVIRTNLSNGWPTSSNYNGTVNITISPGGSSYRALAKTEGSLVGTLGSAGNPNWPTISLGSTNYNGNIQNGKGSSAPQYAGGATQLNLGVVTIGQGATQAIDLLRRPYSGESSSITAERYFAQASLRVLISDDPNDIMNLPCIDGSTQPFDLSKIAVAPGVAGANWNTYAPAAALYTKMTNNVITPLPLAASGSATPLTSAGTAWTSSDGYLQPNGYPVIDGFIKIEEQLSYGSPCGTWKDVTTEILSYGYVGRNIDPVPQSLDNSTLNPQWNGTNAAMDSGQAPAWPDVPINFTVTPNVPLQMDDQYGTSFASGTGGNPISALDTAANPTATCPDPHPLAVIRLERVRDNPSSLQQLGYVATGARKTTNPTNLPRKATVAAVCGVDPATVGNGKIVAGWTPAPYDFWPNSLFDTREGTLRDNPMDTNFPARPTINGVMQYIEIDGKNLANWFGGKLGTITTSGQSTLDPVVAPNDFVVYVSDRRGNYAAPSSFSGTWPPLSYTTHETGEYGWNDIVNSPSNPTTGCPNNQLDTGEDYDGNNTLFTYGANQSYIHKIGVTGATLQTSLANGQLGLFAGLVGNALFNNALCATVPSYATDGIYPMMTFFSAAIARENPPLFFRRAVKIVNGKLLTAVGTCPGGVSCGLTIATENPLYIHGDFNANSGGNGFGDPTIASSVAADAVTLLSHQWNDINSYSSPYDQGYRNGNTTWYRTAIAAGKTPSFPQPTGTAQDYGTDGGVHNFLRYIENWGGTLEYEGSIVNLFYSRQANGNYKCCNTVYSPPDRGYNFDINFLNPTLLPPRTPLFRAINTTGWSRLLMAGDYN
jgi:hypothetical protein